MDFWKRKWKNYEPMYPKDTRGASLNLCKFEAGKHDGVRYTICAVPARPAVERCFFTLRQGGSSRQHAQTGRVTRAPGPHLAQIRQTATYMTYILCQRTGRSPG